MLLIANRDDPTGESFVVGINVPSVGPLHCYARMPVVVLQEVLSWVQAKIVRLGLSGPLVVVHDLKATRD